ncbi:hypothetical protein [Nocardioides sp. zg-DK7169]|uniref:hypothetical protein n=1 Tax=Nocardioides sp. zg-DK7169 TaxID=2736600 RepID=UPI0015525FEF|nr:hypothetical protein [Nocardioides sp. zg-DK7169]NPC97994.1 hypothetical protein [Nocardioides sp. zg-DK7169]
MLRVLAVSSLALVLLAGCGAEDPSPEAALPAVPRTATADPSDSARPTPETTPETAGTTPDTTPSGSPLARRQAPTGDGRALLLDPDDLPLLADAQPWVTTATTPEDKEAVGICQRASLTDIGAVRTVRRTFANGHGETRRPAGAVQVVADFADPRSATRALRVLESWWRDCAEHVDQPHRRIAALRTVDVPAGTARAYRATYGPRARAARHLEGMAFLRHGATITVVRVEAHAGGFAGPRANPARGAVRHLARRVG